MCSVIGDETHNQIIACIYNVLCAPRGIKFSLADVITLNVQYLYGKKNFAQLIKMENWPLKPCLIYEWCILYHVAGENKYREKLGREERRGLREPRGPSPKFHAVSSSEQKLFFPRLK